MMSKWSGASGSRVSGTERWAMTTVSAATGRLIRKIQRQEAYCTSAPPTNGPIAAGDAAEPDHEPMARARLSGSKAPWIIARLPGVSIAAPMPWRMRARISTSALGAIPHSSEASANQMVPTTKMRRRP